jgi:hypothetical protein
MCGFFGHIARSTPEELTDRAGLYERCDTERPAETRDKEYAAGSTNARTSASGAKP